MYTIGQVAQRFQLPISTIRYYDREGLFPNLERKAGIRQFSEADLETLRVIECLKKAGLEMKDIRQFMQWCVQGASTYPQRYELFIRQRANVEAQMKRMQRVMDMIRTACGDSLRYLQKIRPGNRGSCQNISTGIRVNADGRSRQVYMG